MVIDSIMIFCIDKSTMLNCVKCFCVYIVGTTHHDRQHYGKPAIVCYVCIANCFLLNLALNELVLPTEKTNRSSNCLAVVMIHERELSVYGN